METFPGSMTVTTSGTNRQIKHQLYPNLRLRLKDRKGWKVRSSNEYSVLAPPDNGSMCVSFSTDDAELAEGFHPIDMRGKEFNLGVFADQFPKDFVFNPTDNKSLLMIIDEAKSVHEDIYEAFTRCKPTRWLVASTPSKVPVGEFYDIFHTKKKRWRRFHVDYKECPHIMNSPEELKTIAEEIEDYGEHHPFIQSMTFGNFPKEGEDMVYSMPSIDRAMGNIEELIPWYGKGDRAGAVDFSGGGDELVFAVRDGNKCWIEKTWKGRNGDNTWAVMICDGLIKEFKKQRLQADWINTDNSGLGDPFNDILCAKGWDINRLGMGEKPKDEDKYANVRAEMHFELSKRLRHGEIILPKDEELKSQLSWHKYFENERDVLNIGKKKKMPRSPDRADTIAMLFYDMPGVQSFKREQEVRERFLDPTRSNPINPVNTMLEIDVNDGQGILY